MADQVFKSVELDKLKNHPLNAQLYGTQPDKEFIESVKEKGVIVPILVTKEMLIVAGHKRRQAAIIAELKTVRVVVDNTLTDPLDIEERLIHSNKHREKTTEQKAREYARLKEIEAERAAQRKAATQRRGAATSPGEDKLSSPGKRGENSKKGKSTDIAAGAVGMSPATAEKAAEVVEAIDEATEAGDDETAADLTETLNTNVSAAHRKVTGKNPKKKRNSSAATTAKKTARPANRTQAFKPLLAAIGKAGRELDAAAKSIDGPDWQTLIHDSLSIAIDAAVAWKEKADWNTGLQMHVTNAKEEAAKWQQ